MWTPRVAPERPGASPAPGVPTRPRLRAALARALCLLLALPPPVLQAQPAAPAISAPAPEELIATVRANGVERGEFRVLRTPEGDFWLRGADLAQLQVQPREQAQRALHGEAWYSARALGATALRLDEATLTLHVDFRPELLAGTRIDLSHRGLPLARTPAAQSLVLSYRLSAIQPGTGHAELAGVADLNLRVDGLLLRQELRVDTARARKGVRRGVTQVIHDDLAHARRLALGDVVSSAGPYGSTITGGGILLAKVYELAPEVVRHPTARVQASTSLPAEVEVSVDGSPVFRTRVGPGPIALDNLASSGGTRNVRVVITDASGRREVVDQPFLFTDTVLAEGFHEYSYFAGKRSELGVDTDWRYRENAWQAHHRYGASDHLTIAAGGEGSAEFRNLGAGLTLRAEVGLLSLDLLTSRDRLRQRGAQGWSARYTYLSPSGSLVLGWRAFGAGFRSFGTGSLLAFPRREARVGFATSLARLNLSADYVRSVGEFEVQDTGFLRFSTALARTVSLFAELQTTRVNERKGWAANLYLRAELDAQRWNSAAFSTGSQERSFEVETGKLLPEGEGFGYRVGASSFWRDEREGASTFAALDWNLRHATLGLFASVPLNSGGTRFYQADVGGALIGVGGHWGLTRQVTDSFALARLGVPQPGVQIYLNNQPQGRTDARGQLLIPQLSSFGTQELTLDEKELGIQYALPDRRRLLSPAPRSGTIVDFGIRRMRALAGTAWQVLRGTRTPIESREWAMDGPAGRVTVQTGSHGDFYLEDAPPGRYAGTLQLRERRYACRMDVPEFAEPVHELKEGIVCE